MSNSSIPPDSTVHKPARRDLLKRAAGVVAAGAVLPSVASTAQAVAANVAMRATGSAAFGKTLTHDAAGQLTAETLKSFETATASGKIIDWERVPVSNEIRLVNPLAAYPWDKDPMAVDVIKLPPFPALESERLAEEALELYWMALLRDVPLWDYERSSLVRDAVAELRKTKLNANVTATTLFRLGPPEFSITLAICITCARAAMWANMCTGIFHIKRLSTPPRSCSAIRIAPAKTGLRPTLTKPRAP